MPVSDITSAFPLEPWIGDQLNKNVMVLEVQNAEFDSLVQVGSWNERPAVIAGHWAFGFNLMHSGVEGASGIDVWSTLDDIRHIHPEKVAMNVIM